MATREIHLELLIGKQVLDSSGKAVGRIQEVIAKQQGDECVVQEYLIGPAALLERLSAWTVGLVLLHVLGARNIHGGYRVPWGKLDLTDPDQLRLSCTLRELETLTSRAEAKD